MKLARSALPNAVLYALASLRRRPRGHPYKRVAIYKADRLGDFVLALGAIRTVVDAHGVENCVLLGSRFTLELTRVAFPALECVELSSGHNRLWQTRRELRAVRRHPVFTDGVETLVSLRHHRTLHDDLQIGAVPACHTWGVANSPLTDEGEQLVRSRLKFDRLISWPVSEDGECAELAAHRGLVGALLRRDITADEIHPSLPGTDFLRSPYVLVSPFGSSSVRNFTIEQLTGAARAVREHGLRLRLAAEPRDVARYADFARELGARSQTEVEVTQTPGMRELIETVRGARLVVSVETVTAHLATALDQPLVATVGGGHYGWFAPWHRSTRQQWLTHRTDCFGCNWHCRHDSPICLRLISGHDFYLATKKALSAPESPRNPRL